MNDIRPVLLKCSHIHEGITLQALGLTTVTGYQAILKGYDSHPELAKRWLTPDISLEFSFDVWKNATVPHMITRNEAVALMALFWPRYEGYDPPLTGVLAWGSAPKFFFQEFIHSIG